MTDSCSDANEELALNSALEESTPILAESLQRAEQARRRKRRLIAGGLIMLLLGASIVASLALTAAEPGKTKAAVQTEEPQVTIEQFEETVTAEALGQQGWQLWSERKYAEAAQQFVAAIKADPESPNLWNGLGWSLFHSGKRDKAVDAFNQCLKLDENWQAATNGLGQIAYANRDYAQAKEWFLKSPNASAAQHSLVSVYLLTGEYEKAAELSAELLQALPEGIEDPSIVTQRAWLAELNAAAVSKEIPDALRQQIEPPLLKKGDAAKAEASTNRGQQLLNERKLRDAELVYREAIEADPSLVSAHNGLGWALLRQERYAEAQPHLEKAIELQQGYPYAMNGLAFCRQNQGDLDTAIKLWEKILEADDGTRPPCEYFLARAYVMRGEHAKAIPLLEQVVQNEPANTEARKLLDKARSITLNGDTQEPRGGAHDGTSGEPRNILVNGGFEHGTKGWILGSNSGRMKLAPDRETKTEGKQALKITKTGGMPIDIVRINVSQITPGQTVEVSAMTKAEDAVNAWMKFYVWDADGNTLIEDLDVAHIHGTYDWKNASKRFTLPENADSAAIQFWVVMGATVWLDDVKVTPVE